MSTAAGGRLGIVVLLVLLAAGVIVPVLPGDPGGVRLAGVGVLWWFAAVAAPLVATLTVCAVLRPPSSVAASRSDPGVLRAVAVWISPAVLLSVAARVFDGARDAPIVVLGVAVAPLLALLVPPADSAPATHRVAVLAALTAAGLMLWANLTVLADAAERLGVPRPPALGLSAAAAFFAMTRPARRRPIRDAGVLVSAVALVLLVIVIGVAVGAAPWTAWSRTASRPALTFGERSGWVTDGRVLESPASFVFTEAHRVTALSPGVYRVTEEDAPRSVTREWRLAAGDALALRPGDRLLLPAGVRIRFEAGKRVPGSAVSGVVWEDPPARRSLGTAAEALGAVVTLVGGALALLPSPRSLARSGGPALFIVFVLVMISWGAYGVYATPDLALTVPPAAGLAELPALVFSPIGGRALVATTVVALLLLFVATTLALREILAAHVRSDAIDVAWGGLVVAAALAGLWPADPWRAWLAGAGLAASAVAAPRLAGGGARAGLLGPLVGAAAFAGLAALGDGLPAWASAAGAYPALLAAPLAWATARAAGCRGRRGLTQ